jgi:hypothetical protein
VWFHTGEADLVCRGRRRLNVAATRAKERVIVVSSFVYSDVNSTQVKPGTGLEFLKNHLQYASTVGNSYSPVISPTSQ